MPISSDQTFVTSEPVRRLRDYWDLKRAGRDMPDRSDIRPDEIVELLPNIVIAQVELDPFRVFYRLVGTKVVEMSRFDFTGRWLSEMAPAVNEPGIWRSSYEAIASTRAPVYGRTRIPLSSGGPLMVEEQFAIFPLGLPDPGMLQTIAFEDYDHTAIVDPEELRPMRPRDAIDDDSLT